MNAPSRRDQNRQARVDTILDAAMTVFARSGFGGATMESIAAEAGLSKPTLYKYFPTKTDIFDAMMRARREDMLLPIEAARPALMVEQLYRFATIYAETVMRPDMLSLARLIIGEAQRFPHIGRAYQAAGPNEVLQGMQSYLDAQRAAGRLQFEDAELAAEDLWGLLLSAPRTRALHDPGTVLTPPQIERFIHNGLRVFLLAYSTRPSDDLDRLARIIDAQSVG